MEAVLGIEVPHDVVVDVDEAREDRETRKVVDAPGLPGRPAVRLHGGNAGALNRDLYVAKDAAATIQDAVG
jgi:hypothetical protein